MSDLSNSKISKELIENLKDNELAYNYYNIKAKHAEKLGGYKAEDFMLKKIYDSDSDGKVDNAKHSDSADNATTADNANHASTADNADNANKLENHPANDFGLNSVVPSGSDLNNIVRSGFYRLENNLQNAPAGVEWGQLIVSRGSVGDTVLQIATDFKSAKIYWRSGNPPETGGGGSWGTWRGVWNDGTTEVSIGTNGYFKFPNGFIIQWGRTGELNKDSETYVTFPTSFPNACFTVIATADISPNYDQWANVRNVSKNGFIARMEWSGAGGTGVGTIRWFALGF